MKIVLFIVCLLFIFPRAESFVVDENSLVFDRKEILISNAHTKGNKITVMWWNIEYGRTNKQIGGNSLDKNLIELAKNKLMKPTILALGEYQDDALLESTHKVLNENFLYRLTVPYNKTSKGRGIKVYATTPLLMGEVRPLDWVSKNISNDKKKDEYREVWMKKDPEEVQYFERTYMNIKIETNFGNLHLIPFHSVQPWSMILDSWGKLQSTFGKLEVGSSILLPDFSYDGPLSAQFYNIKQEMIRDFGHSLDSDPLLFFGDFNVPMRYHNISSRIYRLFSDELNCLTDDEEFSFPTFSAEARKDFSPMRIDHAFASKNLKVSGSYVLELRGSDHYPIYFVIDALQ